MKKILVPIDFTVVSENAVSHAENIARHIQAEIYLFHVISSKSKMDDAERRMVAYRTMMQEKFPKVTFSSGIKEGSIFDDIGDVASDIDAALIVMGTHGMRGMQFLVGSNALRIVSSSETPIIIVQEKGIHEYGYDDIIVPLDVTKETKQKLSVVIKMAKYFNSCVHLISPFEKDEFLSNTLQRNLNHAAQKMREAGVEHTVAVADPKKGDFDDALIAYSVVNNADLICIMNLKDNSLAGLLGGNYTQKIITNEAQIPALLINPADSGFIDVFGV